MTVDAGALSRYAPGFAILSATSWLIAVIAISLFFALGEPWGTINDVATLIAWLAAIPLVVLVYQAQRSHGWQALGVAVTGLASIAVASALTVLLLARLMTFEQQGTPTAVAGAVFGVWLLLAALLWLGASPLPNLLLALMAVAGLGTVAGVVGFLGFGSSHWLTYVGGALGGLAYPASMYWLAVLLLRAPDLLARNP